jgi:hypothetical protein
VRFLKEVAKAYRRRELHIVFDNHGHPRDLVSRPLMLRRASNTRLLLTPVLASNWPLTAAEDRCGWSLGLPLQSRYGNICVRRTLLTVINCAIRVAWDANTP